MNITYKPKGFGNHEAWYKGARVAQITTTFGASAKNGNYRVAFSSTKLDVYVSKLSQARELIKTFVEDLGNG